MSSLEETLPPRLPAGGDTGLLRWDLLSGSGTRLAITADFGRLYTPHSPFAILLYPFLCKIGVK